MDEYYVTKLLEKYAREKEAVIDYHKLQLQNDQWLQVYGYMNQQPQIMERNRTEKEIIKEKGSKYIKFATDISSVLYTKKYIVVGGVGFVNLYERDILRSDNKKPIIQINFGNDISRRQFYAKNFNISKDETYILFSGDVSIRNTSMLNYYNVRSKIEEKVSCSGAYINSMTLINNDTCVAALFDDGSMQFYDIRNGLSNIRSYNLGSEKLCIESKYGDGIIAIGGKDGNVGLTTFSDDEIHYFPAHFGSVTAVAFKNGEKTMVTAGVDKTIKVWDIRSGGMKPLCTLGCMSCVQNVGFKQEKLIAVDYEGSMCIYKSNFEGLEKRYKFNYSDPVVYSSYFHQESGSFSVSSKSCVIFVDNDADLNDLANIKILC